MWININRKEACMNRNEKLDIGEIVGVYVKDFSGEYDPVVGEVIDYKKSFLSGELYKVQWKVKHSWDGEPPFWHTRESKWFKPDKIIKLTEEKS